MLPGGLPAMRRMRDIRPGFREEIFFGEGFMQLYDELSSPGKKSS
jgi:hypothetical protein